MWFLLPAGLAWVVGSPLGWGAAAAEVGRCCGRGRA